MPTMPRRRAYVALAIFAVCLLVLVWNTATVRRLRGERATSAGELLRGTSESESPDPDLGGRPAMREEVSGQPGRSDDFVGGIVKDRQTLLGVSGARVVACNPLRERMASMARSVVSDETGRFSVPVSSGDSHIAAIAAGFVPSIEPLSSQSIVLFMERGLSIKGRVRDDLGRPVADARVWAHRGSNQVAWPGLHDALPVGDLAHGGAATSDSEGMFDITGLDRGTYQLRAAKAHWSFPRWTEPPSVEAGTGGVEIELWPTHTIVVKHIDKSTNEPLRCVLTSVSRSREVSPAVPVTGDLTRGETLLDQEAQGFDPETGVTRITFAVVRSRFSGALVQKVRCTAPGYVPFETDVIVEGEETRVTAEMEPRQGGDKGSLVVEAFFDGSNAPFSGLLQLMIDDTGGRGRGIAVSEMTDGSTSPPIELPQGTYRIRAMGCGDVGNWWIEASPWVTCTVSGGVEARIRLQLAGNPILLTVVDGDGRAVRGYDLSVFPSSGMMGGVLRWDTPAKHVWLQRWRDGYSGPDLIVPPGDTLIRATLAGTGTGERRINASGNGTVVPVTIILR